MAGKPLPRYDKGVGLCFLAWSCEGNKDENRLSLCETFQRRVILLSFAGQGSAAASAGAVAERVSVACIMEREAGCGNRLWSAAKNPVWITDGQVIFCNDARRENGVQVSLLQDKEKENAT